MYKAALKLQVHFRLTAVNDCRLPESIRRWALAWLIARVLLAPAAPAPRVHSSMGPCMADCQGALGPGRSHSRCQSLVFPVVYARPFPLLTNRSRRGHPFMAFCRSFCRERSTSRKDRKREPFGMKGFITDRGLRIRLSEENRFQYEGSVVSDRFSVAKCRVQFKLTFTQSRTLTYIQNR